ncbi:MAG: methonine synthase [Candidatus Altiarchaeota archaeon]|nr:methonine synthase [Candidatus Altiarchaeota archaeon]
MSVISDDVGSFPLPGNVKRDEIQETALRVATKEVNEEEKEIFNRIVEEIMQKKLDSGLMTPNYPQIHDMIASFFSLMENFCEEEEPWIVKKEAAVIPEIGALDFVARRYFESTGGFLPLRVCVTGPLELYLKNVGVNIQGDLLLNLAESISRFIENAILDKEHIKTKVVCIDEPSLGLNPNLIAEDEDLIHAWESCVKKAKHLDVQIHLHSTNDLDKIYPVKGIGILGIESAEDPGVLKSIDRDELESFDKFLRVGISRTNIFGLVAEFNERFGVDLWETKKFSELGKMENQRVIGKRLQKAYELFNDRIKYAGPDCGLGAWPNQETAFQLLKNTSEAINEFNKLGTE